MAKVHKSIRIEEALAERVSSLQAKGESEAAAYCRVLEAGLNALEHPETEDPKAVREEAHDDSSLLVSQLAAKDRQIEKLGEQLSRALDQNGDLTAALTAALETTKAAQVLQAADKPALEDGPKRERGFWSRLFG